MKSMLRTSSALPLAALALVAFAGPAYAQDTANEDENAPGEIVVTAQKRSENVQDVPVAVSVLSGERLAEASRPSIESAAQMVPSLNFLKSGTTLNQTIFLRGVGTATFSIAGEPSVSTVVDGVVYSRSGEAFSDMVDVAQMEVLRGPQGTLFGKNASAGVINITTQMPKMEFGGSVEASYFDRNEFRLKGAVNLPLGQDLAARLTGFYGEYDGNIRNTTTNEWVNGYKHWGVRGQFLYEPSDDLRLYLAADYYKNDDDCCADIIATGPLTGTGLPGSSLGFLALPTPLGADTRTVAQNLVTSTLEEGWGVSFQGDLALGDHTLTSITAYRGWDNTEIRDGDWLDRAYVGFAQLHDSGPQTSNTFTQELRLTSPGDQALSYVLGAFYSRADSERTFTRNVTQCTAAAGAPTTVLVPCGSAFANPSTTPSGSATFGSTFNNIAVFGQANYKLSDTIRFIAGLRYTHDKLSVFHSRRSPLTGPGIQPNFDQGVYNEYVRLLGLGTAPGAAATAAAAFSNGVPWTAETSNDNLSGKAGFQFDLNDDTMAYVTYARGYKGPAYNVFFNLTGTGTNVIEPETSNSFEVGMKNTLLDGALTFNIAAYYARYNNFQANNPDLVAGVVVTRFTNAGTVSTKGIEIDMAYRVGRNTNISGGLSINDAHVVNFKAPLGAAAIPAGTKLGYAPVWKGSLAVDHTIETNSFANIAFGVSTNFQSSQLSLFAADAVQRALGTIPAYALVNANVGLVDPDDKWKLTFVVRNLFDKGYAAAIVNGGVGGAYRYQIPRDADRYWGVTGRFSF
jgi:iron complex outermembrane receptor protein